MAVKCPKCPREFEKEKEREMHLKYFHGRRDGLCPECSSPLVMQEGCRLCWNCGWSRCA